MTTRHRTLRISTGLLVLSICAGPIAAQTVFPTGTTIYDLDNLEWSIEPDVRRQDTARGP